MNICDEVREDVLPFLGVRIEDKAIGDPSLWKFDDKETLINERNKKIEDKKKKAEAKQKQEEEKKAKEAEKEARVRKMDVYRKNEILDDINFFFKSKI